MRLWLGCKDGVGRAGVSVPPAGPALERTQPELHAVRNELTIANELEHHTRGTT